MSNQNTGKKSCAHGHDFTKENTIIRKNGNRKCRECSRIDASSRKKKKYNTLTKDEIRIRERNNNLKFFYGLKEGEYEYILKSQSYKCANPLCTNVHTEEKKLVVDHDHNCCQDYKGKKRKTCGKCIRGLICGECNLILGKARDNADYLNGLVEYISSWKKFINQQTEQ